MKRDRTINPTDRFFGFPGKYTQLPTIYISSASDRGAGSVTQNINYAPTHNRSQGLEIRHLLSGAKLDLYR